MRRLLIDRQGPLTRCALLDGGALSDLAIDHAGRAGWLGAVALGRVTRVVAGLDAAFVDFGDRLPGLLSAADIRPARRDARIGQLLRTGQAVLVQVKADAHGDKGASLTMDVSLPGRFLVFTPLGDGLRLSKRLGRGPQAAALRALFADHLPNQGGWIVRAEAGAVDPGLVLAEAEGMLARWRPASLATGGGGTVPRTLLAPPDAVRRAVTEMPRDRLAEIIVEGADLLAAVRATLADAAPDLLEITRAWKAPGMPTGPARLFDQGDADGAILALAGRRVGLSHGGSLVIDRTEALTVVDVNGGERGNPLATNLDACPEIARQLRLRNVGGIVVVDFVNMARPGDRDAVVRALSEAVAADPVATNVYGMSRLGLVEVTRARRGPALADLLALEGGVGDE